MDLFYDQSSMGFLFVLLCFVALLTGDICHSSQTLILTGDVIPVTSLYVSTFSSVQWNDGLRGIFQGTFGLPFTNLKNSLSGRNNVNPRNFPLHLHKVDLDVPLLQSSFMSHHHLCVEQVHRAVFYILTWWGQKFDQPITEVQYVICFPSQMKHYLRHVSKLNQTRNLPATSTSQWTELQIEQWIRQFHP